MTNVNDGSYMTRSKINTLKVQHDVKNEQFFIDLGTPNAFLSYKKYGNIIEMEHTEVPNVHTGKGLGKLLAKVCLSMVLVGMPSCSFIFVFLFYSLPSIIALKMDLKCV